MVGDEAKREFVLGCGADHAVLSDGWLAAVRELAGERAVDIVLDPVGGDRMTDSLRSLAPEGRLLVLGFTAGEIPVVKVNRLLLGNTGVLGVASREFFEQQPAVAAELWATLLELRQSRALPDPPVQAYPFADARGALRAIDRRAALGKVVLSRQVQALPARETVVRAGGFEPPRCFHQQDLNLPRLPFRHARPALLHRSLLTVPLRRRPRSAAWRRDRWP